MNIGEMAKRSGLSSKMIRDYEKIGLIRPAGRSESGYRRYTEQDLENLSFIRHARDVDFSLAQIKTLLQLKHQRRSQTADRRTHRYAANQNRPPARHGKHIEKLARLLLRRQSP